mmetsp:Transcript_70251/g.121719  ORF Transcript_70251/g.121719 Transcript_70251/m.121719 type:complete len:464 (+) Transcript_70251:44-1435(+)
MIRYKTGGLRHITNLLRIQGSVFPYSFLLAFPNAVATALLKTFDLVQRDSIVLNSASWSGLLTLIGFLVVFRTSHAYSRFWEGACAASRMRFEWVHCASLLVAFCKFSDASAKECVKFKHTIIRLFSILHATAMSEVFDESGKDCLEANLDLIDAQGLDTQTWEGISQSTCKFHMVVNWILQLMVVNTKSGLLSVPPPILGAAYQHLGNGTRTLYHAITISSTPLPFPYAQICDVVLLVHWTITPLITAQWVESAVWAALFSFIQVFVFCSLNTVAVEIEQPFGMDANDLSAEEFQDRMNECLLTLLAQDEMPLPKLSESYMNTRALTDVGPSCMQRRRRLSDAKSRCSHAMVNRWYQDVKERSHSNFSGGSARSEMTEAACEDLASGKLTWSDIPKSPAEPVQSAQSSQTSEIWPGLLGRISRTSRTSEDQTKPDIEDVAPLTRSRLQVLISVPDSPNTHTQ